MDTAKLRLSERKTKFWSSECKETLAFSLLSRDKIRQESHFGAANAKKRLRFLCAVDIADVNAIIGIMLGHDQ
ncbi:MAG: hypothetical protein IJ160_09555 [Muribaculaceae bacterium]|nr:hypothetical protein [Muribaculaceae bacterium]